AIGSDPPTSGRGRARESALLNSPGIAVWVGEVDKSSRIPGPYGAEHWVRTGDYGLPEQFRFALRGRRAGCGAHDSSTGSAERERKSLHARIEELDLELSVSDGGRWWDRLIQGLFGNGAVPLVADVVPVSRPGRLSMIDQQNR